MKKIIHHPSSQSYNQPKPTKKTRCNKKKTTKLKTISKVKALAKRKGKGKMRT
jgi:hypothetical protein